ncbi:MAG TPA: glycosyltransferase 87 family protein [Oscillospiraceae bacterium]|nr:glycosyltransferase 87 family protein [Oscillospiraceae bacterium]
MNFKKNKLKDVNNTSKLFYIISFASLVVCIIMGVLSNGVTVSNLLFNKDDVFMDFFNSVVDCSGDAYGESGVIYPPLVVLFYKFCSMFFNIDSMKASEVRETSLGMIIFVCFTIVSYILFAKLIYKYKNGSFANKSLFAFFTLFSFPMIYLIERGNIIVLVLPLLLYFVNEYDSDVKYKRHLAYICLAISVAIKIYPVFFGLLLLKKKKNFKNILLCIFYGALFFFVPFIFVGGFSQLGVLIHNILYTSSMFGSKGFGFKVSISNTFSLFGHVFNHVRLFETAGTMFLIITVLAGLFLILFNKWNEDWKIYAVISLIIILVPGFSYIYSVAYMIIPLLFFLNKKEIKWIDYIYSLLFIAQFIFLVAKTDELFPSFNSAELNCNIATVVESIALLAMLVLLYFDGIITFFRLSRHTKVLKIPVNLIVCIAVVCAIAVSGVFSVYYTPSKSGFSVTSVESFTPYDDDDKTLESFYSYVDDEIGSAKTVAFPRVDFLSSKINNKNIRYFDISYDSKSLKTTKSLTKYSPEYIIIYNVSQSEIKDSEMQISYSELKTYMNMYKEISKSCWSKGYEKVKSYYINDSIELAVWEKSENKKNTSWKNGGNGTQESPFEISTAEQLYNFSEFVNSGNSLKNKYVELTNDIDMSSIKNFKPIGFEVNPFQFKGIFNGNGYAIKNLEIRRNDYSLFDENYLKYDIALFGKLGGKVENLIVEDSVFDGYCTAVFARSSVNDKQLIINCLSRNNKITGYRCGELIDDFAGKIESCIALNNNTKGKENSNIVGYRYTSPIMAASYTNTFYEENNKFYLPNNIIYTDEMINNLNNNSTTYNKKIEMEYKAIVHRLCYNGNKKPEDLKSAQRPLELCEWTLSGNEISITHK